MNPHTHICTHTPERHASRRPIARGFHGAWPNVVVAALLAVAMSSPSTSIAAEAGGFWHAPSIDAYLDAWQQSRQGALASGSRALDDASIDVVDPRLQRMEAWLAKGLVAAPPPVRATWQGLPASLQHTGLVGLGDTSEAPDDHRRAAALMQAIRLPTVGASWLASGHDIALGGEDTRQLSGRFGIVHRAWRVASAPAAVPLEPTSVDAAGPSHLARDEALELALTQPLVRTVIHRDGRLDAGATHARMRLPLDRDAAGDDDCEGFIPGFTLGDADPDFHAATGQDAYVRSQSPRMPTVGSLLSIVTRDPLPVERAEPVASTQTLDAASTGFASATQFAYDFDADGVPDLVAWEGRGAAEDGDAPSLRRHRLFFVNVQGGWQLLGHDTAKLSCGGPGC